MRYSRSNTLFIFLLFSVVTLVISGCGLQKMNVQDILNQPTEEISNFNLGKKYIKAGITVVHLTGTPYEIGLAHGTLCKREIIEVNKPYFDYYKQFLEEYSDQWSELSKTFKKRIPQEYIEEMRGISDGAEIDFDKIFFLNALTTISMADGCFAFAFKDNKSKIITFRQIDNSIKSPLYKKMILYIIKPQKGYGFAAILNPGWVSGETGINENGITVSENNINIKQTEWNVMPINHLSRVSLQYSESIDDVGRFLRKQKVYPSRLLFVSSKQSASFFEIANQEMARINMNGGYLAMANHACTIPSKNITYHSVKRLDLGNKFFKENLEDLNIEKAIDLVRTSRITWYWNPTVHNRQSIIFSPTTLDFWIAIPPSSDYKPASYGPYIGFNLLHELYGTGHEANPRSFPAH